MYRVRRPTRSRRTSKRAPAPVVRRATTDNGCKPATMASRPKMGMVPIRLADAAAQTIPRRSACWARMIEPHLSECAGDLAEQILAEKIALRHQASDMTLESLPLFGRERLGRHDYDWDVSRVRVCFESLEQFEAVHLRHHQVEDDQVGDGAVRVGQGLGARSGLAHDVVAVRVQDTGDRG